MHTQAQCSLVLCGSAQEATVKAPAESTSGEVPLPGSRTSLFVSSRGQRDEGSLCHLSRRSAAPVHEGCTLKTHHPSKAPLPTTTPGRRFSLRTGRGRARAQTLRHRAVRRPWEAFAVAWPAGRCTRLPGSWAGDRT